MSNKLFLRLSIMWCLVMISSILLAAENRINVSIDPRIELLAIVQFISEYDEPYRLVTQFDFIYKQDVLKYFSSYKTHPAVKMRAEMSRAGYIFDAPPASMLYLSDPPELKLILPLPDILKKRIGENKFKEFIKVLRDFAVETNFKSFFDSQRKTYQNIVENVRSKMNDKYYIEVLENYYGIKQNSYNIIIAPLYLPGGFGPSVKSPDGTYNIYNICGPFGTKEGLPLFGNENSFRHLAWHEFGHSFVDLERGDFSKKIIEYSSLYDPIANRMRKQGYGSWENCVEEHLVRAVTTRLAYLELGEKMGDDALQNEKSQGFFYVEDLCKRLEQYENQRKKYPIFYHFYPELIDVLKKLSNKKLVDDFYSVPFTGNINHIVTDENPVIFIIPTNEMDKTIQHKIHEYVKSFINQFFIFKGSPIMTDEEALNKDLSSNPIIVFGTPKGNLWLVKYITRLPVQIEENKITTDTTFAGSNLRFITTWPNPQNSQKGMVINTAQRAEDIIGIHKIQHILSDGMVNYVVAKGTDLLGSGVYRKQTDQWTFK